MNVRFVGSADQIERLAKLIPGNHKLNPSRKQNNQKLLYLEIDDRIVESLLNKAGKSQTLDLRLLEE